MNHLHSVPGVHCDVDDDMQAWMVHAQETTCKGVHCDVDDDMQA